RHGAGGDHGGVPGDRAPAGRVRGAVSVTAPSARREGPVESGFTESRAVRILLRVATWLVLAFLYVPLAIVVIYAFNKSRGQSWPPSGFTAHWFSVAWHDREVRSALWLSVQAALGATTIALVLGSAAAFAVHRFRFFGRETIS